MDLASVPVPSRFQMVHLVRFRSPMICCCRTPLSLREQMHACVFKLWSVYVCALGQVCASGVCAITSPPLSRSWAGCERPYVQFKVSSVLVFWSFWYSLVGMQNRILVTVQTIIRAILSSQAHRKLYVKGLMISLKWSVTICCRDKFLYSVVGINKH
jgi:predicted permease